MLNKKSFAAFVQWIAAYKKYGIVAALSFVCIASWWYAIGFFAIHREDVVIAFADIANDIALPFRIAVLAREAPDAVLPMPVFNVLVRDVADTWGEARSERRTHEGVDIFAPRGTPVFSATRGYVTRLNIGTRGGNNVMVAGPGGLRYYYAHFDRLADGIEPGRFVTPDTVLGFVGDTGNASGTPPHLHFGIYIASRQAINPYPLLIDRWNE